MKLVGLTILDDFVNQHGDAQDQISAWTLETKEANWQTPVDIRTRYATASFLANNRVIFNIKGNRYRLEVKVNYKNQLVLVTRIGTHAEYSKW